MPEESGSGTSKMRALGWQEGQWCHQKWESMYSRGSVRGKRSMPNRARLVILAVRPQPDCVWETADMRNSRTGKVILQVMAYKECREVSARRLRPTLRGAVWSHTFSLWVFHLCLRVKIASWFVFAMMSSWSKLVTGLNMHEETKISLKKSHHLSRFCVLILAEINLIQNDIHCHGMECDFFFSMRLVAFISW